MIEIKVMTIEDYQGVYDLWNNTAGMGMRSLDDSKEGISQFIQRNPKTNFIACDGSTIAGVIMSGNDGRRGYIYHMAVAGEYRNQGIAKKLVAKCLMALKDEGINKAALVAFKNNQLGNDFWQSQGFVVRDDLVYRNISLNEENL